jgi:adenylate cyclase
MNARPLLTRPPFWRSIAARMALLISAILIAGFAALALIETTQSQRLLQRNIEQFGQLLTQQLAAAATEPLFAQQPHELVALIGRHLDNPRVLGAAIYDRNGALIASAGFYPAFAQLPPPRQATNVDTSSLIGDGPLRRQERSALLLTEPVTFRAIIGGHAVLALSRQPLEESQRHIVQTSAIAAAVLSLLVFAVALWLGRRLTQPIHTLLDATRLLERGEQPQLSPRKDELGQLSHAIGQLGLGLRNKGRVETLLQQFLDREVANKLMSGDEPIRLGGEQVEASVLFADIVGFTTLSEKLTPAQISEFLNEYFHYFDACARFYFGTVDKFIGDAVMVVFGAPRPDPLHAYHAAACAVLMQRLANALNRRRETAGLPPVYLRIGVNSGEMLAGVLGSQQRVEYTVVGDAVNLASRLCSAARPGEVLISAALRARIIERTDLQTSAARSIVVRGKETPVEVYSLEKRRGATTRVIDQMIADLLDEETGQ